ncbi:hypothetical protein D3C86_1641780 [compost metagenome]
MRGQNGRAFKGVVQSLKEAGIDGPLLVHVLLLVSRIVGIANVVIYTIQRLMLGEVMQTLAKPVKQQGKRFAVELQMLNP